MLICFWSPGHIGDIYIDALFLHYICKLNYNIPFYYYYIQGDVFVNNIQNLSRIFGNTEYNCKMGNETPPECAQDISFLQYLYTNVGIYTHHKVSNVNGCEILFLNTWCIPMGYTDFDLTSAIPAWKNTIELINKTYGFNLICNPVTANELITGFNIMKPTNEPNIIEFISHISERNKIFVYNYNPRSVDFDMNKLNSYIHELANNRDNFVFLANENSEFNVYPNVKCCDTYFNITKKMSCENLLQLWNIAKLCNTIIIIPSGSSWIFFHNLHDIKNINICMFDGQQFVERLNTNIQLICDDTSYSPIKNC